MTHKIIGKYIKDLKFNIPNTKNKPMTDIKKHNDTIDVEIIDDKKDDS